MRQLMRRAALMLTTATAAAALAIAAGAPALAAARPDTAQPHDSTAYHVVNGPVRWYLSPNTRDIDPNTGDVFNQGQTLDLWCYQYGAPAGPNNNTLWYRVVEPGRWVYINDHYLNTPGTAANPQPQTGACEGAAQDYLQVIYDWVDVVNAPSAVAWGNFPSTSHSSTLTFANTPPYPGGGGYMGLACYEYGNPGPGTGNPLWYYAYDLYNGTIGWINDHYLDTPGTAANPQPQAPRC